jgi:type I restriction enzyme S subunit
MSHILTHGLNANTLSQSETGLLPPAWTVRHIRDVVRTDAHSLLAGPFGTIFKAKDFRKHGVRIIQLRHVTEDGFVWGDNETYMDQDVYERLHKPYTVRPGDLLVTKMGEPPGIACIYPAHAPPAMVTPDVIRASIDESIADAQFLVHLYNSPIIRSQVARLIKGATRPRVSLNEFFELKLPIPPLCEQRKIAELAGSFEMGISSAKCASARSGELMSVLTEAVFT